MRHKIPDEMKKDKFTITIDEKLNDIVNEYLKSNDIKRSNYIEKLIREDMEKKGKNIDIKFQNSKSNNFILFL